MGKSKTNRRGGNRAGGAKKGTAKRVFLWIALILVVLFVTGAAVGIAFIATDGFGGRVNTLRVQIGYTVYSDNANGVILNSGTEIKVKSMTKVPYEYRIEASDKSDFGYSLAGEKGYRWKYLAGEDVTGYFTIEKTENGFKVSHNGIYELLKQIEGTDAVCDGEVSFGDYFTLIITCGSRERRFGFYPDAGQRPTDITLDHGNIVFNPNKGNDETDPPPKGNEGEEKEFLIIQEFLGTGADEFYTDCPEKAKANEVIRFSAYTDEGHRVGGIRANFGDSNSIYEDDYLTELGQNMFEFVMPSAESIEAHEGYIYFTFYLVPADW